MPRHLKAPAAYLVIGLIPVVMWFWPFLLGRTVSGPAASGFLPFLPLVALAGVGLMGWKLNQTRILLASLVYLTLYVAFRRTGLLLAPDSLKDASDALATALPLSFAFVLAGKESPLLDRRFALRAGLAILPFVVLGAAAGWAPEALRKLTGWAPWSLPRLLGLPWIGLGSVAALGLAAAFTRDLRLRRFTAALLVTLVPFLFAVRMLADPMSQSFHTVAAFTAISVILLHCLFSMYWHRVYVDELTEIPNRRALDERLHGLQGDFAIAMLDIDHFKAYNDEFGHDQGDSVLRFIASHISRELGGRAYRYGGEEFAAVFEATPREEVHRILESARSTLETRVFRIRSVRPRRQVDPALRHAQGWASRAEAPENPRAGTAIGVTISVGVAFRSDASRNPEEVLKRADEALYEAKQAGRNRTVMAGV